MVLLSNWSSDLNNISLSFSCSGSSLIQAMMNELHDRGIDHFSLDSGYKEAQCRWIRKFGEPYLVAKDYWGPGKDHMIWLCQVKDFVKTFSGKPQSGFPYIYLKN